MEPAAITMEGAVGSIQLQTGQAGPFDGCSITLQSVGLIELKTQNCSVRLNPFGITIGTADSQNYVYISDDGVTINAVNLIINSKVLHKETTMMKNVKSAMANYGITLNQLQ
jgi:hypothetical protein